jgi:DNA-binding transcriptional LysR family regulator
MSGRPNANGRSRAATLGRRCSEVPSRKRASTPLTRKTANSAPPLRLDIVDLETFEAVASLGSFIAAARHLNITQPSVSSRIQRLEASLGAQLLIRTTRRVELTRHGTLLRAEAKRTLEGLRKLVGRFRNESMAGRKRVIVAATQMIAATMLPDVLRSHRERYPEIDVQLRDLQHKDAMQALTSGEADVAVVHFDRKDAHLKAQPLRDEPLVLIVQPNHPLANKSRVTPDEMAAYPLMMPERYDGIRARIAEEAAGRGLTLKPALSAGNLMTLMGLLDAGMGILLLPRIMARHSLQAGHVMLELKGIALHRTFSLVTRRDSKPNLAIRRFCQHLRQELSRN